MEQLKLVILFIIIQVAICQEATCQFGFTKKINLAGHPLDVDDIIYHNNKLIIKGNIYSDSIKQWGLLTLTMDTLGNIIYFKSWFDPDQSSDLAVYPPSRFIINNNGKFIIPDYYFQKKMVTLFITDSLGNLLHTNTYFHSGLTIYPKSSLQINNSIFILGKVQRENFLDDVFIIKTDSIGQFKWIKYYGSSNYGESYGDAFVNKNETITICANQFTPDYFDEHTIQGWRKPWIFTIDTSGAIIKEWRGQQNDNKTLGGGPFYRALNGDWIICSWELKQVNQNGSPYVFTSPTITRLDSSFNLKWKKNLTEFTSQTDLIKDLEYDQQRDEFVAAGDLIVKYSSTHSESEAWIFKFASNGDIIWNITDTISYNHHERHYVSGLTLSPSGTVYVAGFVNTSQTDSWIFKITSDGCIDTICSLTGTNFEHFTQLNRIEVYPNPTEDVFHIKLNSNYLNNINSLQVMVYDNIGQRLQHFDWPPGEDVATISLTNNNSGIYFINIVSENVNILKKLIKY